MTSPSNSDVQNLLPVQAYFSVDGTFQTFIGQGQPFYAIPNPDQSGLNITNSTINSTTIGATTPSSAAFTTATVSTAPVSGNDVVDKIAAVKTGRKGFHDDGPKEDVVMEKAVAL